jgi:hypothetical protein
MSYFEASLYHRAKIHTLVIYYGEKFVYDLHGDMSVYMYTELPTSYTYLY